MLFLLDSLAAFGAALCAYGNGHSCLLPRVVGCVGCVVNVCGTSGTSGVYVVRGGCIIGVHRRHIGRVGVYVMYCVRRRRGRCVCGASGL